MSDNTRDSIVKLAAELFKQYGIRSVSIDDICRQLNISKKTFYVYFSQKGDLVQAVLDYTDDQISQVMSSQCANKSVTEMVKKLIAGLREIKEMSNQPPFFYDLQKYYPDIKRKHDAKVMQIVFTHFCNHLRKGIDEGIYRSDLDIEACATFITLVHLNWVVDGYDDKYVSKKRLLNFYAQGLFKNILSDEYMYLIK